MNSIDLTQANGFPLEQNTLAFMQKAYTDVIGNLTRLFGSYIIISGVTETSNTITSGWVIIQGEVLPFSGGPKASDRVTIEETKEEVVFEDFVSRPVYVTRRAKLSTSGSIAFSQLRRLPTAVNLVADVENLTTRVNDLENKLAELTNSVHFLETRMTDSEGNISTLQSNVATLLSNIKTGEVKITFGQAGDQNVGYGMVEANGFDPSDYAGILIMKSTDGLYTWKLVELSGYSYVPATNNRFSFWFTKDDSINITEATFPYVLIKIK